MKEFPENKPVRVLEENIDGQGRPFSSLQK